METQKSLTQTLLKEDSASHGVGDAVWLLKDLLLQEMLIVACDFTINQPHERGNFDTSEREGQTLHDLLKLNLKGLNGTDVGNVVIPFDAMTDAQALLAEEGKVTILEVQNPLCVLHDGTCI